MLAVNEVAESIACKKSDNVATKAMLALIKRVSIYFSDFLKKRRVWPQVICLLSMGTKNKV